MKRNGIRKALTTAVALIIQVVWTYTAICHLRDLYPLIEVILHLVAFLLILSIYNKHITSAMKMPWIMLIMIFPVFGMMMYFLAGWNIVTVSMKNRYKVVDEKLFPHIPQNEEWLNELESIDKTVSNQSRYIKKYSKYPLYKNTDVNFYDDALKGLDAQIDDLKKAESFIFMEYHAIEDSVSFDRIHKVLLEKVKAGVEVRVIYDYVGSMSFIGNSFAKKLVSEGIQCRVFNPAKAIMNLFLNNRDHRKITVIDGKIGYAGGYNLADEYFHVKEPYGHWLDTGLRIEGDAVKNLTITFLENWDVLHDIKKNSDEVKRYLPEIAYTAKENGFVQPYADIPMDEEQVGENVYINVLRNAKDYAYFITPYLIITDEMRSAFAMAAKSGVDVRIITPGIPDKKLVYSVTRSYYSELVENGVRIFEYTPGFCHAKQCVSDDKIAICGTINLDFRSLYHHFENGIFIHGYQAVDEMKQQFDDLFPICREVTERYRQRRPASTRFKEKVLRFFAPLL